MAGGGGGGVAVTQPNGTGGGMLGTVMLEEPVDEDAMLLSTMDGTNNDNYVNGRSTATTVIMEPSSTPNGMDSSNIYGIYGGTGAAAGSSRSITWEYLSVSVTRVPGYGFGIAVSGGSDNPHFANGDPAIAISDVLKGGPAEGKLAVNDRIISANGVKLENVEYGVAVGVLRESGPTVNLVVKRRVVNACARVALNKLSTTKYKNCTGSDFGLTLSVRVFVKDAKGGAVVEGDEIIALNNIDVNKIVDWKKIFNTEQTNKTLSLAVVKQQQPQQQQQNGYGNHHHAPQPSYNNESTTSGGNLYVQPPTRRIYGGQHSRGASIDDTLNILPPPPPVRPPLPKDQQYHHQHHHQQSVTPPPPPPPPLAPTTTAAATPTTNHQPPPLHHPRYVNFVKRSHLGLRLCGGNNVGIYISAVQEGTGAEGAGLVRGDRILRVNDLDFTNLTREEAIASLGSLSSDSLVSMVTRFIPEYDEILRDNEFHDKIYYRTKFDLSEQVRRNSVVVVSDTLCSSSGSFGWEGFVVGGAKVRLPNFKQAKEIFNLSAEPYVKVGRRKLQGELSSRPIAIWSHFNADLADQLVKHKHNKFFRVVSTTVEEIELELRSRSTTGGVASKTGVLVNCSVELFERLWGVGVCPGGVVVKTEDKGVLKDILKGLNKNYSQNYYATLIRSFKGSPQGTYRKQREELEWVEKELGAWSTTVNVTDANTYVAKVSDAAIRATTDNVVWVDATLLQQRTSSRKHHQQLQQQQQQSSSHGNNVAVEHAASMDTQQHQQYHPSGMLHPPQLPDYNKPPPFTLGDPLALPPTTGSSTGGGRDSASSSSFKVRLAHSPEPPPPAALIAAAASNGVPAPRVDRTKKPPAPPPNVSNSSQPPPQQQQQQQSAPNNGNQRTGSVMKPVPPPKPKLSSTTSTTAWQQRQLQQQQQQQQLPSSTANNNNGDSSYYLNLPVTSKVVQQQQQLQLQQFPSSGGSAFELYRKPGGIIQQQQQQQQDTAPPQHQPPPPPPAAPPSSVPLLQENTTSGTFDYSGGILLQRNVPVGQVPIEVRIPEGAIPRGARQTIWFHAVPHNRINPDRINGNLLLPHDNNNCNSSTTSLISPLIKFGPEGLRFAKPIEIRIPQYSRHSNASVLLGNNENKQWSKINIHDNNDNDNNAAAGHLDNDHDDDNIPFKIVSLTIQQF